MARGAVQVEKDILEALEENILSGAFLDVFETEPLPKTILYGRILKFKLPHILLV